MPIRLRITLVFALGMVLLLVCLGSFAWVRDRADLLDAVDMGLRSRAQVIVRLLSDGERPNLDVKGSALIDPDEAFAQVLGPDGSIVDSSPAVADAPLIGAGAPDPRDEPLFVTRELEGFDDPVRLLATAIDAPSPGTVVVVGATLGDMNEALERFATLLLVVGALALIATTAAAWFLVGAALRPVERMRREAAALSVSEPDRRLDVPGTKDELARLALTLNELLDRVHRALEQERRFVDDASHELRTPLATLSGEMELALARPRTGEELVASLRSAQEDVDRLQRLADDLLVLARSRAGAVPVRRVPSSLRSLLERSAQSVRGLAAAAGVTLAVEGADTTIEVDPERIQQALRNLLENAIRHAPRDSTVHIRGELTDTGIRLMVEDAGAGFPPGLIGSAFEPFVRGDPAGDASGAGAGLGLAIVRAVAEAHGGEASAQNLPGGARVTMTLRA